jgi:hypothetical protein
MSDTTINQIPPAPAKPKRKAKGATRRTSVPYANATTGKNARVEIEKILKAFGCEQIGFMDDYAACSVLLQFKRRGRQVQLRASAAGWAAMYLRHNPWSDSRRRTSQQEWGAAALRQGLVAVNSILRDWIKGEVTAVETGMLSFEAVFAMHTLLPDGQTLLDKFIAGKIPALENHHTASP